MSTNLTINGVTYAYPQNHQERGWGQQANLWAQAVTSGMLQKAGGSFTLTAEVNFGATYGLLAPYYKTSSSNIASAGQFRLARTDVISWRNQANGANLDLGVNSSNALTFNGIALGDSYVQTVSDTATIDLGVTLGDLTAAIVTDSITNSMINSVAAIDYSKLAALTINRAIVSDGSGFLSAATTTATEIGYVNGVTSAIQTQLDGKSTSSLTSAYIFVGNVSNLATAVPMTGDIGIDNTGLTAIQTGVIVNADVSGSAAVDGTKISPNWGSQDTVTTGASTAARFIVTGSTVPANGIYLSTTDTLAFATNSARRAFVNATGQWAMGGASSVATDGAICVGNASAQTVLSGTTQIGVKIDWVPNSSATGYAVGVNSRLQTPNSSFTTGFAAAFYESSLVKGGLHTITRYAGLRLTPTTSGGTGNACITDNEAYSGNYFIHQSGTIASLLSGPLTVANTVGAYNVGGTVSAQSADYVITDTDGFSTISMTTAGTNRAVTLPAAANNTRRMITVKKVDTGTGLCTVTGTINGVSNFILADQDDFVSVVSNGTNYDIVAKGIGTRVQSKVLDVDGAGFGATNNKIRRIDTSVVNTGNAITRATSSNNGNSYTINQAGTYAISHTDRGTVALTNFGVSVNSNQLTTSIFGITQANRLIGSSIGAANQTGCVSITLKLAVGDVVRPHGDGQADSTSVQTQFSIEKIGI